MSSIQNSDETLKKIRKRVIVLDLNKKTELFNISAEIFIFITQAKADLMLSNDIREKALIKSAQNNFKVNFLFIVSENIGFSDEKQILNLLLKISEMEKTKVFEYWPDGQSTNRLDNKEKRAIYNNTPSGSPNLILKDLPNGFPSLMLGFSSFTLFIKTKEVFTIKEMDNFVKALDQASNDFREQALINGFTNLEIDEIILKVKQHIGRFEIIKTNIDHFFEEYWRGAFSSIVTNRARTIQTNDRNAATILPAVANLIKSFEKHSVLPDQVTDKLKGIVTYTLLLYNYGIRNDLFIVALQLDLQPYKYGDKNTRKKIEKIAKLLGIQPFQIDLTNQEIIEGCMLWSLCRKYQSFWRKYRTI